MGGPWSHQWQDADCSAPDIPLTGPHRCTQTHTHTHTHSNTHTHTHTHTQTHNHTIQPHDRLFPSAFWGRLDGVHNPVTCPCLSVRRISVSRLIPFIHPLL